jgi:hypothetical protein
MLSDLLQQGCCLKHKHIVHLTKRRAETALRFVFGPCNHAKNNLWRSQKTFIQIRHNRITENLNQNASRKH